MKSMIATICITYISTQLKLKYSDSSAQVQSVSQKTSMGTFAYSFYLLTAQALALWMFDNIFRPASPYMAG